MLIMNVTDFARDMNHVLNMVEYRGEEVLLMRNKKKLAKIIPQGVENTALEVFSDLYRTLPEVAAESWLQDSRSVSTRNEMRNPLDS
jgi:hypothetical protein